MAVTAADLKIRFPLVFPASFADAILTAAIAEAGVRVDEDLLGDLSDAAITYLAAHIARTDFLAQTIGSGITGAQAGGVSISYAAPNTLVGADAAGGFYLEFLRILRLASPQASLSGMVG